ncbi:GRIP domain-containing protein [Erysiphe neolycopersici]|uniref:GRIP domain-containing protein n=1 Tax=Erysiphe neolycopersici TaxID=212602 RepID=A0A420HZ06_9PEZI|nr:GRIP domain-containing protein [Erysiphe neolycopersici]
MSSVTSSQPPGNPQNVPKSKNGRKKRNGNQKTNGYSINSPTELTINPSIRKISGSHKDEMDEETKEASKDQKLLENGDMLRENNCLSSPKDTRMKSLNGEILSTDKTDTSMKLEAMSHQRESLLAEVEKFRRSLEDIQDRHLSDLNSIKRQHVEQISKIEAKHYDEISAIKTTHLNEIETLKTELDESNAAKEVAQTQYQNLLERINTIKSSLGERFKADRQELADAKTQIEELESQRNISEDRVMELEVKLKLLDQEHQDSLDEISSLQNQLNLSQNNLSQLHEDFATQKRQLTDDVIAANEATNGWEMLAREERSIREGLEDRIKELEEQISSHREALELAVRKRDTYLENLEVLRKNIQDIQDAQKIELRQTVESYEKQLRDLNEHVQKAEARSSEADLSRSSLQVELERLLPIEKELKEKNLLIGKLRHEAIVLNDHLTKALRFLKKAKPEDSIDRQIVTNHFLHFLALDRSDPKKFQVLQLIASLLNWTDEQKEQAGLTRPGTSSLSQRLPLTNFHRTPSTQSLSLEFLNDAPTKRESLSDLWKGFLERSVDENESHDRDGIPSILPLPKTDSES